MMTFEEYKKSEKAINLLAKVKRKLERRGFDLEEYSDDEIFDEIEDSITSVNERRHFNPTDTLLFEDKYESIVTRLVVCSFAKMGAEGELAHSENGISRTYTVASEYPNDILREVIPLGRLKSI